MYCPRCNRQSYGEHCTECQMTIKEAKIWDEGFNQCLRYVKQSLPSERVRKTQNGVRKR